MEGLPDRDSQLLALDQSRAQEQQQNAQEDSDLRWLMSGERGRAIIWRILTHCDLDANPFHPSATQTAFQCGARVTVEWLKGELERVCPELLEPMRKENYPL